MKRNNSFVTEVKSIVNNIISNALWELIRNLMIPVIVAIFLAYPEVRLIIFVIVLVLSLIGFISLILKYKHTDYDYIFLRKEIFFEYRETYSIYNISHRIKAMVNNLDRFCGRYTWDYNKVEMQCKVPANSVITPRPLNDAYQKYDIYFGGRKYNIGDIYSVDLESKMNGEIQFPFFATTVIRPTHVLSIHIKLPLRLLASNNIRLVISPTPSEVGITKTIDVTLDENGEYVWEISNPRLSYEYAIEWDFNEEKKAQFND